MLFLLSPADVAFDGSGNKYEADLGHQAIIKYDSAGQYITHWSLFNAISIAVNLSTNQIYAGLVNNEVHIFDDRGNALHTFGNHGTGDGEFDGIKDIAIDDIYIYIADRSNHRVQIFNKTDRSFLTSVGGHGTGDGELKNPSGLTVGSGRQLYVADTDNNRIQLFTFDSGTSRWSYHSQFNLANPQSLYLNETTGGSNMLYVFHPALSNKWSSVPVTGHDLDPVDATSITTNSLESKVFTGHLNAKMAWNPVEEQLYASDRSIIVRIDDEFKRSNWIGVSLDQFNAPGGIAVDRSGKIYITDTYQQRILTYAQDGSFLDSWGKIGSGDGEFFQPRGIAVDSAGNIYVADTENYRIQKFRPDGTFDKKWGERGIGDGKFMEIKALVIDDADNVYVASWKTVQKFDKHGNHLHTFGDHHCGTTGHAPCTDNGKLQSSGG